MLFDLQECFEKTAIYLLGNHYGFYGSPLHKIIAYDELDEKYKNELVEKCWKAFQAAAEFIKNGTDVDNEFVFRENFEKYIKKTYIKNSKSKAYLLNTYDGVMYEDKDTSLFLEFWEQCYDWLNDE